MLSQPFTPLLIVLPILMVDSLIEMSFLSSMVSFLHRRAGKWFDVSYPSGQVFALHGKPLHLLANQGHTSNGAAGTALILVGIGGFLVIWLQTRHTKTARDTTSYNRVDADMSGFQTGGSRPSGLFTSWVVMTILSNLLTLAALIYTFLLTSQTDNQIIDINVASGNPEPDRYPADKWTPENWFIAVLNLPLAHNSDRNTINQHLALMRGWRYNLIPLFIIGLITAGLAVFEWLKLRRSKPANASGTKIESL